MAQLPSKKGKNSTLCSLNVNKVSRIFLRFFFLKSIEIFFGNLKFSDKSRQNETSSAICKCKQSLTNCFMIFFQLKYPFSVNCHEMN
mgnify:FL=1